MIVPLDFCLNQNKNTCPNLGFDNQIPINLNDRSFSSLQTPTLYINLMRSVAKMETPKAKVITESNVFATCRRFHTVLHFYPPTPTRSKMKEQDAGPGTSNAPVTRTGSMSSEVIRDICSGAANCSDVDDVMSLPIPNDVSADKEAVIAIIHGCLKNSRQGQPSNYGLQQRRAAAAVTHVGQLQNLRRQVDLERSKVRTLEVKCESYKEAAERMLSEKELLKLKWAGEVDSLKTKTKEEMDKLQAQLTSFQHKLSNTQLSTSTAQEESSPAGEEVALSHNTRNVWLDLVAAEGCRKPTRVCMGSRMLHALTLRGGQTSDEWDFFDESEVAAREILSRCGDRVDGKAVTFVCEVDAVAMVVEIQFRGPKCTVTIHDHAAAPNLAPRIHNCILVVLKRLSNALGESQAYEVSVRAKSMRLEGMTKSKAALVCLKQMFLLSEDIPYSERSLRANMDHTLDTINVAVAMNSLRDIKM